MCVYVSTVKLYGFNVSNVVSALLYEIVASSCFSTDVISFPTDHTTVGGAYTLLL